MDDDKSPVLAHLQRHAGKYVGAGSGYLARGHYMKKWGKPRKIGDALIWGGAGLGAGAVADLVKNRQLGLSAPRAGIEFSGFTEALKLRRAFRGLGFKKIGRNADVIGPWPELSISRRDAPIKELRRRLPFAHQIAVMNEMSAIEELNSIIHFGLRDDINRYKKLGLFKKGEMMGLRLRNDSAGNTLGIKKGEKIADVLKRAEGKKELSASDDLDVILLAKKGGDYKRHWSQKKKPKGKPISKKQQAEEDEHPESIRHKLSAREELDEIRFGSDPRPRNRLGEFSDGEVDGPSPSAMRVTYGNAAVIGGSAGAGAAGGLALKSLMEKIRSKGVKKV